MSEEPRSLDAPPSPVGFLLGESEESTGSIDTGSPDPPPPPAKPNRHSYSDYEDKKKETQSPTESDPPAPGQLGRRESKVRFSDIDLALAAIVVEKTNPDSDTSGSDNEHDKEIARLAELSGSRSSRINLRRTSLSHLSVASHHSATEDQDISLKHPRQRVSMAYESLDYKQIESQNFLKDQLLMRAKNIKRLSSMRWLMHFLIGLYVAVIAVLVWLLIKYISKGKFLAIYKIVEKCDNFGCTIPGLIVWILFNCFFTFIGAYLVTFHAPSAAGSGIPQVKCYLNGIKMPGLMSLRTLLAKAGGVVLSVSGGLACGKEGPMIHSGAICASGLASGKFGCGKKNCKPSCCDGLRSDDERRDFVAAGAASGVSAAFASPVGGVLFAMEEGASFIKQELTWRMLFSSAIAGLFLNLLMSLIKGHPNDMSSPGLISFGYLGDIEFKTFELPIFAIMGLIGGLLGALFVAINYKITIFRRKKVTKPWHKVGEACLIAAASAILLYALIYGMPDCQPVRGYNDTVVPFPNAPVVNDASPPTDSTLFGTLSAPGNTLEHHESEGGVHKRSTGGGHEVASNDHGDGSHGNSSDGHDDIYGDHGHGYVFRGLCPYGQQNRMASILFGTPEGGLHAILHAPLDEWSMGPLFGLVIFYHLLTTWTYGLNVSSGLFIPSLLIGAVWGRIVGMAVMSFIPSAGTNIAKYCLIGAAAQLGGFVRMTISLTVIIIECTGDITFGLPIMITLILAKWMGDFFNPGIYDLHIEIWGAPLLGWNPPEMSYTVPAKEMMSSPVDCLRTTETLDRIKELLDDPNCHHGFPVVDDYDPDSYHDTFGRLKGFIMKSQLEDIVNEAEEEEEEGRENSEKVDLSEHMDIAPYSVYEDVSFPKIFNLFRNLGLRHLVVVNDRNRVVGIITRINVARFRGEMIKGKFRVEELEVVEK